MRHGAEPWDALAVKLMLKWPNLYYSTSAFAPRYYPQTIIDYANTRGADKIMYAGYFPMGLSLERIFAEMPNVGFKDDVWPKFLRENAVRVFKLDECVSTPADRFPFPVPFGWFCIGYPDEFATGTSAGPLLLRPPPRGLARRRRRAARAGRLLPAPRRPPRPRRHRRRRLHRVPVPRLEVRRRGHQHRDPLLRAHQPQGPPPHLPGGRAQRPRRWPGTTPTRPWRRCGRSRSSRSSPGRRATGPRSSPSTTRSRPRRRSWPRTASTRPTSATCTTRPRCRCSTPTTPTSRWPSMRSSQKFPTPRGVMEGRIDSTSYGPGLSKIAFSGIIDTLNLGCATPDRRRPHPAPVQLPVQDPGRPRHHQERGQRVLQRGEQAGARGQGDLGAQGPPRAPGARRHRRPVHQVPQVVRPVLRREPQPVATSGWSTSRPCWPDRVDESPAKATASAKFAPN